MKKCTKCNKIKPLSEFHRQVTSKDGFRSRCKLCRKPDGKKYYKNNIDKINAWREIYWKDPKNKEKRAEYDKDYRKKNIKRIQERKREYNSRLEVKERDKVSKYRYREENKGKYAAYAAKRRNIKTKATPPWITEEQLKEMENIYVLAKELEKQDGIKRHVDHIMPLQGKNLCGLHVPWNLQILTAEENIKKGNRIDYLEI